MGNFLFLELLKYRKANSGFIILLTSTRLMDYNNGFSISSFFLSLLSFLWIGAQFPQEKFLSYGRILTLHYYFLLMCILLSYRLISTSDNLILCCFYVTGTPAKKSQDIMT